MRTAKFIGDSNSRIFIILLKLTTKKIQSWRQSEFRVMEYYLTNYTTLGFLEVEDIVIIYQLC